MMGEKKVAKYLLVAIGIIIALLCIAYPLIDAVVMDARNSDKQLDLFTKIMMSSLYFFRGCLPILLILFVLLFWVLMLVDCGKRSFAKNADKIIWFIVIIFFSPMLGALIYYFAVKNKSK